MACLNSFRCNSISTDHFFHSSAQSAPFHTTSRFPQGSRAAEQASHGLFPAAEFSLPRSGIHLWREPPLQPPVVSELLRRRQHARSKTREIGGSHRSRFLHDRAVHRSGENVGEPVHGGATRRRRLAEELINALSKIEGLKVASRTVDLPLADLPSKEEWQKRGNRKDAVGHHARRARRRRGS